MTQTEQTSVNQLKLNQVVMGVDVKNLTEDVQEMKQDIKEIKNILAKSDVRYVQKSIVRWMVGTVISAAVLWYVVLDHIHNVLK